jgi:MOSC domain-containing protein YiiM
MTNPTLLSIQVSPPKSFGTDGASDPMDRPWTTGFYKEPVVGPVRVGRTNLEGDGQADLVNHGGPEKAVLAYSADHYPIWRSELDKPDLPFGAFGENFTVIGQTEADLCIGDRWVVGEVRLEVSQPRLPCWKLARRWRIKDLALRVDRTGRSGWYFRVLSEGWVTTNQVWFLEHRPFPDWTVARANQLWLHDKSNLTDAAELASIPSLAVSWKEMLARRLQKLQWMDDARRSIGPNES